MKAISRAFVYACIFILLATSTVAQEQQSRDTDLLRVKIEQFENTDITSKSTSVQSIYQRTLLRLYSQLNLALQQDIKDLKNMLSAVGGVDAESHKEITLQIQKLTREQDGASEKIQTLNGDVRTSVSSDNVTNDTVAEGSNAGMR